MFHLIYWGSLLFVAIVSVFFWQINGNRNISSVIGMRITMANAMMSSVTVGTVLGLHYMTMFLPTITGIVVGIVVGSLIGKNFGFAVVMDGWMAGVMGGMMGAMLGVMMMGDHVLSMILFLDLVEAVMVLSLYTWILRTKPSQDAKNTDLVHSHVG